MKRHAVLSALLWLCITIATHAQSSNAQYGEHGGGAYHPVAADAAHPCVTPEEYEILERQIAESNAALRLGNAAAKAAASTTFSWPLRRAAGLKDCGYYSISNYVDQDTTAALKDYNCDSNTYNGHKGTDIFTYPYPMYKLDHDQVEVIAAAAGTIVGKTDGKFDKNCSFNSLTANSVVIQHADGSVALYLHMKNGSLTSKGLGNTVSAGEYLGVVASSGNSTGPHLHFEVWSGTTVTTRQDPFSGNCNTLNSNSWWISQPAYRIPSVLKVSVNHAPAVLPGCPTTETPNEDSCFAPGTASAYFYAFMRDETYGMPLDMTIEDAAGDTLNSWTFNSIASYNGSYRYWTKPLPATPGIYTLRALYNGSTCSTTFKIDCSLSSGDITLPKNAAQLKLWPNPVSTSLTLSSERIGTGPYKLQVSNLLGQEVYQEAGLHTAGSFQKNIPLANLPEGLYFLTLECGAFRAVRKIVKQ